MFSITVRSQMMVAHSLRGAVFGPAQRLHGATYVVDAGFRRAELDADGLVVDIGAAAGLLHDVLGELTYRNLDEEPALTGVNTTTEALARVLDGAERPDPGAGRRHGGRLGPAGVHDALQGRELGRAVRAGGDVLPALGVEGLTQSQERQRLLTQVCHDRLPIVFVGS